MTTVLQQNLEALQQGKPALYNRYVNRHENKDVIVKIEKSKSGKDNLFVETQADKGYIYSTYDPSREVEAWVKKVESRDWRSIILVGFGLGYHFHALRRKLGNDFDITVIEFSWEIFDQALQHVDLSDIFRDEHCNLLISESDEVIHEVIVSDLHTKIFKVNWAEWAAYCKIFKTSKEALDKLILTSAKDLRMNQNTYFFFQSEWPKNMLYNLPTILKNPGVKNLFGKFEGKPAIVVSAGPSLNKNIDQLHELKGKAVILCVDTAYRVLQNKGIVPDLIFSLDGSDLNYRHFEGVQPSEVPLVFLPTVHHKIVEEFGQRSLSSNVNNFIIDNIIQLVDGKGAVNYSGSVATLAFDVAYSSGANPIILIGQDLAYPAGQAYAKGTMFEKMKKRIDDNNMLYVVGIDGEPVLTDLALDKYRRWFEERIKQIGSDRLIIDATEGGAKIKGTEIMTLSEAEMFYCKEPFAIKQIIDDAVVPTGEDLTEAINELKKMHRVLHQLARLGKLALYENQGIHDIYKERTRKVQRKKVQKHDARLSLIENHINRLNQHYWIDLMMQKQAFSVAEGTLANEKPNETEYEKGMRITKNAEFLYRSITDTAMAMKEFVGEALRRLHKEDVVVAK
ncbi:motility associated factor glycosyltransferase family protein [Brevibacillus invocatus]|uniref:motility associated factor glycosyltransferase family protein n=1 Tax=Brevibacillus invocatus TaxID=173959 RepID=UPI00203B0E97|nr:6-hydroxymethylpterin diphosphokinase MptE-like protein [Brevibacillus invocatus]MCM3079656.1 DUF115 domain-containing protein [Brevibacillus invocatus]MCM3431134.1 DUF115 domain-containing protein [Brevibacillus invocatus]